MDNIVFIVLRRMRQPLLTLIVVYAIAVLGLVLIPARDASGNVWHMELFHALYFVSFMATTIGFGEIPQEFSDGQRLWVMFALYATVIAWIYAIGNMLALLQDPAFRQAITESRFARRIRNLREPFYLVCGYGQTGSALVQALTERDQHAVVIDIDPERVSVLQIENLRQYVPALHGDAARPVHLLEAGLEHAQCHGVVALTNVNEVNLKVAITSKLLHPDIKVICRADSYDVEANMASFGTDFIIDPFDTFAMHLATALRAPCLYLLQEWLTGMSDDRLREPVYPPREGIWIVCGYGRFGKAIYQRLKREGLQVIVIEADPERTGMPAEGGVLGRGTEAVTLRQAGVGSAVGLVAGTDDDANNLSIIMTARELNDGLFVITRQNQRENQSIIDAVQADMTMQPSFIIANKIRVLLATPLLYEFIGLAQRQKDAWACELISRISALVTDSVPAVWELSIEEDSAHAVAGALERDDVVTVGDLLRNPRERELPLQCIALLLKERDNRILLPAEEKRLRRGDRLLFCGTATAEGRMAWTLRNEHVLSYVLTGACQSPGDLWQWLTRTR